MQEMFLFPAWLVMKISVNSDLGVVHRRTFPTCFLMQNKFIGVLCSEGRMLFTLACKKQSDGQG